MIKAIIMDMDGTLLDPHNRILKETKEALIELEKKGVTLILASGRSYTRLIPYAKELKMNQYNGYLIEVDGIALYDVGNDNRQVLRRMKPKEIEEVYSYLMTINCEAHACFDDGLFVHFSDDLYNKKKELRIQRKLDDEYPWTAGPWDLLADLRDGYPNIHYIEKFNEIQRDINKIQLMQDEKRIEEIYIDLINRFKEDFEIFRTCPRQLEILPKGFSKGKTLKRLMNEKGWKDNEVLAFGDGENDVSMFEVVQNSYAMGQAKPFVQEKARYVTKSNVEQGIFETLKDLHLV